MYIIVHFSTVIYTRNEIRTNMSWICRECTYPYRLICRTSSRVYALLLRLNFPKRRYDCGNLVSRSLPLRRISRPNVSKVTHWHDCAHSPWFYKKSRYLLIYINFFSKSLFEHVLNFVLNSIIAKPDWRLRELQYAVNFRYSPYRTHCCDNERNTFYYIKLREVCPTVYRAIYCVG